MLNKNIVDHYKPLNCVISVESLVVNVINQILINMKHNKTQFTSVKKTRKKIIKNVQKILSPISTLFMYHILWNKSI